MADRFGVLGEGLLRLFSGPRVLATVFLLLWALGLSQRFVYFPLGHGEPAGAAQFAGMLPFEGVLWLGGLLVWLLVVTRSRWLIAGLFFSAAMLLAFVVHVALDQPAWLGAYLFEAQQRSNLNQVLVTLYQPVSVPEPSYRRMADFYRATEQLSLAGSLLGRGWYLCALALLGWLGQLIWLALWPSGKTLAAALALLLAAGSWPLLDMLRLLDSNRDLLKSEYRLAQGDGHGALLYLERAVDRNPALGESGAFLRQVWHGFNLASGGRGLVAQLGDDVGLSRNLRPGARSRLLVQLDQRSLMEAEAAYPQLASALVGYVRRQQSQLWLGEARRAYESEDWLRAARLLEQTLTYAWRFDAALAAVAVQLRLEQPRVAQTLLDRLAGDLGHRSYRAVLHCVEGDLLSRADQPLLAREAYFRCRAAHGMRNTWATLGLGGS